MEIQLLNKAHNRKNFSCEENSLTDYIRNQVSQDIRKKLAACFVAVDNKQNVIGYYTLTSQSLGRDMIPGRYLKQLPENYNAPVVLLGRLARDIHYKGRGLGEHLLLDALFRIYYLSRKSIGAMAVIVDPIHDKAVEFYQKYGFGLLPDSKKMFLPIKVIEQLI